MKVIVDRQTCEGSATCAAMVPRVFEVDDEDRAVCHNDQIDESNRELVLQAVALCPVQALSVTD